MYMEKGLQKYINSWYMYKEFVMFWFCWLGILPLQCIRKLCLGMLTFSYKIILWLFWKSSDAVKPPSKSDRLVQFNYINAVSSSALALSQLSNTCITESYKQMIYFHSDSSMCTHVTCRGRLFHVIPILIINW